MDESPAEAHGLEAAPFELVDVVGDGSTPTYALGEELAAIGDLDGDGFPDLAVGVGYQEVLVAFGGGPPPPRASDLRAGVGGLQIVPETDHAFSIGDIDGAGDFDGDGYDDLLVGIQQVEIAPTRFENRAYVVFGGPRPTAPVLLADVAAGRGGTMLGGFGVWGATGVGDVDGDGYADVALTGPSALEHDEEGVAYVVRGRPDPAVIRREAFEEGPDGYELRAAVDSVRLHQVDGCGDVDGDGRPDLLVSGYRRLADDTTERLVFVVFGREHPGSVELDRERPGEDTAVIVGSIASHDHFLGSPPQCGDFDGDGRADVLVPDAPNDEVAVVLDVPRGRQLALGDVGTYVRGFRVRPLDGAIYFASVAGPIGDLDGDGRTDLMARMHTYDGEEGTNWAIIVLGKADEQDVEVADVLSGEGGLAYAEPWRRGSPTVFSNVVPAGDFDGNGRVDVALSDMAYYAPQTAGRVRLMLFDEAIRAAD
ncbi:MAG: FG-GAP repeat protein [Myxococcales bacterium]|nr:FG-GAP repeat protein [Myxococcales bacterium]